MTTAAMNDGDGPWCPSCGSELLAIDTRPGKEAWACPIAMSERRVGFPKGSRTHGDCFVYEKSCYIEVH